MSDDTRLEIIEIELKRTHELVQALSEACADNRRSLEHAIKHVDVLSDIVTQEIRRALQAVAKG